MLRLSTCLDERRQHSREMLVLGGSDIICHWPSSSAEALNARPVHTYTYISQCNPSFAHWQSIIGVFSCFFLLLYKVTQLKRRDEEIGCEVFSSGSRGRSVVVFWVPLTKW